jgi:hypothetical protein
VHDAGLAGLRHGSVPTFVSSYWSPLAVLIILDSLFFSGAAGLVSWALADDAVTVAARAIARSTGNVLVIRRSFLPSMGSGSLSILILVLDSRLAAPIVLQI